MFLALDWPGIVYQVCGTRYEVRDAGYGVRGTGHEVRGTRYVVRGMGYVVRGTSAWYFEISERQRVCGHRVVGTRHKVLQYMYNGKQIFTQILLHI